MRLRPFLLTLVFPIAFLASYPVKACGFGEAPSACGQTAEGDARYMLLRVTNALKVDRAQALNDFQHGTAGFRTQDTYVFCIGPDGVMSAHPDPALQSHDVRELHDQTGNYFIATMLATAEAGKVSSIRYLFPKPGMTYAVPKTTYFTRAGDQVCGVGVYDGDTDPAPSGPLSRRDRMAALRTRLSAGMPDPLHADWSEFTRLYDEQMAAQDVSIAKAVEQLQAVQSTMTASR